MLLPQKCCCEGVSVVILCVLICVFVKGGGEFNERVTDGGNQGHRFFYISPVRVITTAQFVKMNCRDLGSA